MSSAIDVTHGPSDAGGSAVHLVVTTLSELLDPQVAAGLGQGVRVFHDAADAVQVLQQAPGSVRSLLVDVGAVGARWTGLRLLKHVRADRRFDGLVVWLLASRSDDGLLRQWVGDAGAAGIAKRSARGVARAIESGQQGGLGAAQAPALRATQNASTAYPTLRLELARERAAADAMLIRLGLQPADWRQPDGALRLEQLLDTLAGQPAGGVPAR